MLFFKERKYAEMPPSYDTIQVMEMFVLTLKPFHLLTDAMSTEKTVSICSIWRLLLHIKKVCDTTIRGELSDALKKTSADVRTAIWTYINERYNYSLVFMFPLV